MGFNLKRWPGATSSKGIWLVKQTPGVVLQKLGGEWYIERISHAANGRRAWTRQGWGERWRLSDQTEQALRQIKLKHPTRRAALDALEAALAERPDPVIAELI